MYPISSSNVSLTNNLVEMGAALTATNASLSDMAKELQFRYGQNILINWDFRNPVNQRGQNSYTTAGYTIDMWAIGANIALSIVADGIIITIANAGGLVYHLIENSFLLNGSTVTLSVEVAGIVHSMTRLINTNADTTPISFPIGGGIYAEVRTGGNSASVRFIASTPGASVKVTRIKLELGSISTLANDPLMDYGRELAVCQRYYFRVGTTGEIYLRAAYQTINWLAFFLPTPVTMRITPTRVGSFSIYPWPRVTHSIQFNYGLTLFNNGILISANTSDGANHGWSDATLIVTNLVAFDAEL